MLIITGPIDETIITDVYKLIMTFSGHDIDDRIVEEHFENVEDLEQFLLMIHAVKYLMYIDGGEIAGHKFNNFARYSFHKPLLEISDVYRKYAEWTLSDNASEEEKQWVEQKRLKKEYNEDSLEFWPTTYQHGILYDLYGYEIEYIDSSGRRHSVEHRPNIYDDCEKNVDHLVRFLLCFRSYGYSNQVIHEISKAVYSKIPETVTPYCDVNYYVYQTLKRLNEQGKVTIHHRLQCENNHHVKYATPEELHEEDATLTCNYCNNHKGKEYYIKDLIDTPMVSITPYFFNEVFS